ncbi:hypothetical protein JMJ35_004789 [Cladonia borealis]|uniref:Membrane fusion mating protein FIG1 n=1 Tax=Cladonia borealis TaxID=184061 RepID=A0AA39V212_9LECA|nr:hypothetical protein JMJ35_004789 [Cladonia borealis]
MSLAGIRTLVLAGCTSSSTLILRLYLVSLSYQEGIPLNSSSQVNPNITATLNDFVNGTSLEVRTGYFGLCVSHAGGIWLCNSNSSELARQFRPFQDPLNLIWASQKFKDGIVFSGLIIVAIAFAVIAIAILVTFPGWHEERTIKDGGVEYGGVEYGGVEDGGVEYGGVEDDEVEIRDVKEFPTRSHVQIALAATVAASFLALVSMVWQHTASVAVATTIQDVGYGTINSKVGASAMALGWVGLGCLIISAVGMLTMILSLKLFTDLTDK